MNAVSRPRLSTCRKPTCRELNWPWPGSGLTARNAALPYTTGASAGWFSPATTRTKSADRVSDLMAEDRKVSFEAAAAPGAGGHGSRALSRPIREDSPAAKMMAAKLAARGMLRKITESRGKVSDRQVVL